MVSVGESTEGEGFLGEACGGGTLDEYQYKQGPRGAEV